MVTLSWTRYGHRRLNSFWIVSYWSKVYTVIFLRLLISMPAATFCGLVGTTDVCNYLELSLQPYRHTHFLYILANVYSQFRNLGKNVVFPYLWNNLLFFTSKGLNDEATRFFKICIGLFRTFNIFIFSSIKRVNQI